MKDNDFDFGHVVYVGPALDGKGGIATVANAYRRVIGDFHYVPVNSTRGKIATALTAMAAFVRIAVCRLRGARILHVHYVGMGSWPRETALAAFGRAIGFRTVMHCHCNLPRLADNKGRDNVAKKLARASANIVLAEVYRQFATRRLGLENAVVVPNFIVNDAPVRPIVTTPNTVTEFLYLGLLNDDKGFFDLLQACGNLKRSGRRFRLVVGGVGNGERVDETIRQEGIRAEVQLCGWITGKDKADKINRADVLVLPSYSEGMPMSVIEAMQSGCAVIGTAVGAIPDMISNGETGYILQPGDVSELTRLMADLIDNPSALARFKEKSFAKGADYVADKIIQLLTDIYRRIDSE